MNLSPKPIPDAEEPTPLHRHAMDNLRFIRQTMERSTSFTAVPGWGTVGMGVLAVGGAVMAHRMVAPAAWLTAWLATAVLASVLGVAAMLVKARRVNESVLHGSGRRFALGLFPPLVAGLLLTAVFHRLNLHALMPATWLLLYGTAVVTGGAFSVKVVPVMGSSFMALSVVAFLVPWGRGDAWMALGFGLLNIVFGCIIARKHGG
ncbi:MAG: hypothetical protein HY706_17005 [Candidatus Hydrogenedentes bacterium]|nr:hypothetical protein [Candidatus Hydrogenedentota bacterium]